MAVDEPSGSSRNGVDDLDRSIISLLQPDGRRPFSSIASELEVSEGTVRQRYRRLVDSGVLQVVAVADPFRIGYNTMAMIGVGVSLDGGRTLDEIASQISSFPEVSYVVMSTGSFDLLVEVITPDQNAFTRFLTQTLHQVEGLNRTETYLLLRIYKMALGGWRPAQIAPLPSGRHPADAAHTT